MAGMFYTLQEVVEKLGKSESQVQDLIRDGKLREFRDGAKLLFKVSEVEDLTANLDELAEVKEDSFVELLPEQDISFDAASDSGAIDEDFLNSLTSTQVNPAEDSPEEADTEAPADDSLKIAETQLPPEDSLELAETEVPSDDSLKIAETQLPPEDSLRIAETQMPSDESLKIAETQLADDTLGAVAANMPEGGDDSFFASLSETLPGLEQEEDKSSDGFDLEPADTPVPTDTQEDSIVLESDEQVVELGAVSDADVEADVMANLTSADTNAGTTGINVLAESEGDFIVADDSKGETQLVETGADSGLGDLDDDLNLDSVGSGSGLLDLSLQADDTSLGAVLDDILPSADEVEAGAGLVAEEGGISAEADKIFEEEAPSQVTMQPVGYNAPAMARYIEVLPDAVSNACGVALLLPLLAVIYAVVVVINATFGISPALLEMVEGYIWYVAGGLAVMVLLIIGIAAAMGGSKGSAKSAPKARKKKEKKPKKAKKKKK